jgi:hypothetical protein
MAQCGRSAEEPSTSRNIRSPSVSKSPTRTHCSGGTGCQEGALVPVPVRCWVDVVVNQQMPRRASGHRDWRRSEALWSIGHLNFKSLCFRVVP